MQKNVKNNIQLLTPLVGDNHYSYLLNHILVTIFLGSCMWDLHIKVAFLKIETKLCIDNMFVCILLFLLTYIVFLKSLADILLKHLMMLRHFFQNTQSHCTHFKKYKHKVKNLKSPTILLLRAIDIAMYYLLIFSIYILYGRNCYNYNFITFSLFFNFIKISWQISIKQSYATFQSVVVSYFLNCLHSGHLYCS